MWDVIPPGEDKITPWYPDTADVDQEPKPVVSFHDSAGHGWKRDVHGVLRRDPARRDVGGD